MGRKVMDGGFRRIKAAPAAPVDGRLALVEQFAATRVPDPVPVPVEILTTEEPVDLASMDIPVLTDVFVEDAQEPAEEPQEDGEQSTPAELPEAAEPDEATGSEDAEPEAQTNDADYDPIAAVLG